MAWLQRHDFARKIEKVSFLTFPGTLKFEHAPRAESSNTSTLPLWKFVWPGLFIIPVSHSSPWSFLIKTWKPLFSSSVIAAPDASRVFSEIFWTSAEKKWMWISCQKMAIWLFEVANLDMAEYYSLPSSCLCQRNSGFLHSVVLCKSWLINTK